MRLALLLITCALLSGQDTGTVEGTVTNSVTGAPVASVRVTLRRSGAAEGATASTDVSGGFRFSGVRAGEIAIRFEADGYISADRNISATLNAVHCDQKLTPASSIDGRVLDDNGQPAADVTVELYRFHFPGRQATLKTGRDGLFRFSGLPPRSYAIAARPASKPKDGSVLAPTWYPGTTEHAEAERIVAHGGAELTGYEIRLRRTPVWSVQGTVTDEQGKPIAGASIALHPADAFQPDSATATSGPDGTFRFPAVRPGGWQVRGTQAGANEGYAMVTVDKHDVERVTVRVYPPFMLDGFVEREEPRDPEGKRKVSAVSLLPVGGEGSRELAFHEQDGKVHFPKVQPGRYIIFPLGFKPGYYVDSITLGEQDVFGKPVELMNGATPFRVVYKADAGIVRGTVEDGGGTTVVLLPRDEQMLLDGQFIRTAKCDGQGRFEVGSLRPGDYYAFAFDRVDEDAFEDVGFVRNLRGAAASVHVEAGHATQRELKVTAWPE
jgi:5-hydroxyisourate hydrolase-like protein (transthyretin family)